MTQKNMDAVPSLIAELQNYTQHGISIWLMDAPSSPDQVCDACAVSEGFSYMRDYIFEDGKVREIHFDRIPDV